MINKLRKAFTLVELLIVIIIIGILAAVVLITLNPIVYRARATATTLKSQVAQLCSVQNTCIADKGNVTSCDEYTELNIPAINTPNTIAIATSTGVITGTSIPLGSSSVTFTFTCDNQTGSADRGRVVCTDGATGDTDINCSAFGL